MTAWTEWQAIRPQVAISGRVVDADGQAVAKAEIEISSKSDHFKCLLEGAVSAVGAGERWERRLDRTVTQSDGLYYFLDLPEGKYRVRAVERKSGKHYEKTVSVSRDKEQHIKRVKADFKFG